MRRLFLVVAPSMFFFALFFCFSRDLFRPPGSDQFDSPDGGSEGKQSFGFHESWRFATHYPDVGVGRLFPKQRCDEPGDTADLNLNHIMESLVREGSKAKGILALRTDRQLYESRLRRDREHRDFGWCCSWRQIPEQHENHPVRQVRRQFHTIVDDFLFSVVVVVSDCDLSRRGLDGNLSVVLERRARKSG